MESAVLHLKKEVWHVEKMLSNSRVMILKNDVNLIFPLVLAYVFFTVNFYLSLWLFQDVTMKIISFSQQGSRVICILAANGSISNVTLRQPNSSGGTLTYEVWRFSYILILQILLHGILVGFTSRVSIYVATLLQYSNDADVLVFNHLTMLLYVYSVYGGP